MSSRRELYVIEELTFTTGCRGRGLNCRLLSPWASTLPLSYPVIGYLLCNRLLYSIVTMNGFVYIQISLGDAVTQLQQSQFELSDYVSLYFVDCAIIFTTFHML